MKRVQLNLTDEQFDMLAQLAHDASLEYDKDIPISAVIMCATMKGMAGVRRELCGETTPKLRLVHNERARDTERDIQEIPQGYNG